MLLALPELGACAHEHDRAARIRKTPVFKNCLNWQACGDRILGCRVAFADEDDFGCAFFARCPAANNKRFLYNVDEGLPKL